MAVGKFKSYSLYIQGTELNAFYAWMGLPYFALPENGVSLMIGQDITIYGDELINVPIINDLKVTYNCAVGTQSGNNLIISTIAENIGTHPCQITIKNGNRLIDTYLISINISAQKTSGIINILRIGDSTMGGEEIGIEIENSLQNNTINFIGTQGTIRKHEGYPGKTFVWLATDALSPFVKAGVIDITAYFKDKNIATPDIVYLRLGINDSGSYIIRSDAHIDYIITNVDALISAFLNFNSNLKVIVALPTTCENTGDGWNANYDESTNIQDWYLENIHHLQKALSDRYSNGLFNPRVKCSYEWIGLDRDNGYPKIDGKHSNGVHFSDALQMGRGLAAYINPEIKPLGVELINQSLWATAPYWWSYNASATFDGVKITNSGGVSTMLSAPHNIPINIGKTYRIEMTFTGSDALSFPFFTTGGDTVVYLPYAPGTFVAYRVATGPYFVFASWNFVGTITKLSMREVL